MHDETLSFHYEEIDFEIGNPEILADWLCDVAEQKGFELDCLTYIFCSDAFLLDINRRFLDHDYYTDIITFPIELEEEDILSGDIFISVDRVEENAKEYGVSFERELARVMVHGLLHLCGLNDHTDAEKEAMRNAEDMHLAELGI